MRFKMMSKKYADAVLEEEVKDDEKETKKRSKTTPKPQNPACFMKE